MRKDIKELVNGLSPLEHGLWEFICASGRTTLREIRELNPKYVGALGKLKSKGLVIIEKLSWYTYIWPIVDMVTDEICNNK